MTSCQTQPVRKGYKCIDCWACSWPAGSNRGTCYSVKQIGPSKNITTCKAAGTPTNPLFDTREECIENCGGKAPGVTCYRCDSQSGTCVSFHPTAPGTGKPLAKCPNWANVYPTLQECREKCVESAAQCWMASPGGCNCQKGPVYGPHGPLKTCDPSSGSYDTQAECLDACRKKPTKDDKTLWILLGVGGGILLLLIIIGIIIYAVWKHKHKVPQQPVYYY